MYRASEFIVCEANKPAVDAVCNITKKEDSKELYVYGGRKSGKTHLLDYAKEQFGEISKIISVSDISLRLDLYEDDNFFDEIGARQILLVDNFDQVFDHLPSFELMDLLLLERRRLNLATILCGDGPLDFDRLGKLAACLKSYSQVELRSLDDAGKLLAIDMNIGKYKLPSSPMLSADAKEYLANSSETPRELQDKVNYLLNFAKCSPGQVLNRQEVVDLLS